MNRHLNGYWRVMRILENCQVFVRDYDAERKEIEIEWHDDEEGGLRSKWLKSTEFEAFLAAAENNPGIVQQLKRFREPIY